MQTITERHFAHYDKYLLFAVFALLTIGLLMITSASMAVAEKQFHEPLRFLFRQGMYAIIGISLGVLVLRIKMEVLQKLSFPFLLFNIFLLILVLVPGIGRQINGSARWLGFGPLTLQVSELVKLSIILFLSQHLVTYHDEIRTETRALFKPLLWLGIISILLLLEPDFGATTVILISAITMLYLAGVRLWQFGILLLIVLCGLGVLAISSPYRLLRLTSFLDPWSNQFKSGYQLTQSLIAFGRGGLWGMGLGGSIQKLFYLPEAHTDFLFAVLAEELGLVGIMTIISLYALVVYRAFLIGKRALLVEQPASGYTAYGIATWLGAQAFINMGVNSGLLPTKGLTLPLISYGGSSLVIVLLALAILFRIDYEARFEGSSIARLNKRRVHFRETFL